jgi:hypothetical protein
MADKTRFIVFGVRDDLLIEIHRDDFDKALIDADLSSCADYKARIWDNYQQRFIEPHVIDLAMKYLSQ